MIFQNNTATCSKKLVEHIQTNNKVIAFFFITTKETSRQSTIYDCNNNSKAPFLLHLSSRTRIIFIIVVILSVDLTTHQWAPCSWCPEPCFSAQWPPHKPPGRCLSSATPRGSGVPSPYALPLEYTPTTEWDTGLELGRDKDLRVYSY